MAWPINVPGIEWVTRALRLRSGDAPRDLVQEISPVMDVFQQGLGLASQDAEVIDHSGAATGTYTLCAADADRCYLVRGHVRKTGAGGAFTLGLGIIPPNATAARYWLYREDALPATARFYHWYELARGQQWLFVPPGASMQVFCGAMVGADTLELRFHILAMPGGFRPW